MDGQEHKITLNDLKKRVDRLVEEGHGHRTILLWTGGEENHYKKLGYPFIVPDSFDEAIHNDPVDKNKTILLG